MDNTTKEMLAKKFQYVYFLHWIFLELMAPNFIIHFLQDLFLKNRNFISKWKPSFRKGRNTDLRQTATNKLAEKLFLKLFMEEKKSTLTKSIIEILYSTKKNYSFKFDHFENNKFQFFYSCLRNSVSLFKFFISHFLIIPTLPPPFSIHSGKMLQIKSLIKPTLLLKLSPT